MTSIILHIISFCANIVERIPERGPNDERGKSESQMRMEGTGFSFMNALTFFVAYGTDSGKNISQNSQG